MREKREKKKVMRRRREERKINQRHEEKEWKRDGEKPKKRGQL